MYHSSLGIKIGILPLNNGSWNMGLSCNLWFSSFLLPSTTEHLFFCPVAEVNLDPLHLKWRGLNRENPLHLVKKWEYNCLFTFCKNVKRQLYPPYLTKWREFSPFQMERILVRQKWGKRYTNVTALMWGECKSSSEFLFSTYLIIIIIIIIIILYFFFLNEGMVTRESFFHFSLMLAISLVIWKWWKEMNFMLYTTL